MRPCPASATVASDAAPTGAPEEPASRFAVDAAFAGSRLDQFLVAMFAGRFSRTRIQAVIENAGVRVNGQFVASPKRKVETADIVDFAPPEASDPDPLPEAIPLDVLFEDAALIVIDKPAGLVVHPGAGNWTSTLVNALLFHCGASLSGIGGVKRPGIVHRLDKDTSGVMVIAKTDAAHRSLADQFAAHGRDGRMERAYRAIVWGAPQRMGGTIDAPLGRAAADRTKRQVVAAARPDARHAVTRYRTIAKAPGTEPLAALVECVLETGRTHQIRVHMAHLGHPLVGDDIYGAGFRTKVERLPSEAGEIISRFRRQGLHAFRLGFEHPSTGEALRFETPMPPDMQQLAAAFSLRS